MVPGKNWDFSRVRAWPVMFNRRIKIHINSNKVGARLSKFTGLEQMDDCVPETKRRLMPAGTRIIKKEHAYTRPKGKLLPMFFFTKMPSMVKQRTYRWHLALGPFFNVSNKRPSTHRQNGSRLDIPEWPVTTLVSLGYEQNSGYGQVVFLDSGYPPNHFSNTQ